MIFELSNALDLPLEAVAPTHFEDWVKRHQAMIFRTAWRMLGST